MRHFYYIITEEVAAELGLKKYRYGNDSDGYLVNIGDLAVYGVEKALEKGAREITAREAAVFVDKN